MAFPSPGPAPPGMPQTFYSPFPPGHPSHPGAPPGHVIIHSPRPERARVEKDEEQESSDKLLKQIWLGIGKINTLAKRNEQALRDITGRQSTIEDRLSLMDQRVMRISAQVDEVIEKSKTLDDGLRTVTSLTEKSASVDTTVQTLSSNVAALTLEVGAVKDLVGGISVSKVEETTSTLLTHVTGMLEYTQELSELKGIKADIGDVKGLIKEIPIAAAPPPP
ncbi:MAG: hypothetical protein M1814_003614 [Vezdaea aestivalis]|nr:MAG: hypothetical protein M1814_003614 [Vezdaea aestivalis]